MSDIVLLIEAQGARRQPAFFVEVNGQRHQHSTMILSTHAHMRHLECHIDMVTLVHDNELCVIMDDKQDQDNIDPATGEYVDHYVSVKQVRIDDIDADAVLFKQSHVTHSMPDDWVANMRRAGHEILPRYPGNDLHLNGRMTFAFKMPFWLEKTQCIDGAVAKKYR